MVYRLYKSDWMMEWDLIKESDSLDELKAYAEKHGGSYIGAFDEDNELVEFYSASAFHQNGITEYIWRKRD